MDSIEERLTKCFLAVFTDLSKPDIPPLSAENYYAWDSLASVMLMSVISEEFSLKLSPRDVKELTSFGAALEKVKLLVSDHK